MIFFPVFVWTWAAIWRLLKIGENVYRSLFAGSERKHTEVRSTFPHSLYCSPESTGSLQNGEPWSSLWQIFVVVVQLPSRVRLFATPRTAACQASLCLTSSFFINWATWRAPICSCVYMCMQTHFSCVWLFVTLWAVAPLPMGFSRQEYWSRLPCPSPGDLPNPGVEPRSPALQADSFPGEPPGKPSCAYIHIFKFTTPTLAGLNPTF